MTWHEAIKALMIECLGDCWPRAANTKIRKIEMSIWNWIFGQDTTYGHCGQLGAVDINPATGLPMIDGVDSVDVGGSPYGIDMHDNSCETTPMAEFPDNCFANFGSE